MPSRKVRTTKGERDGVGTVADLVAGLALGPLGSAGSKLIRALAASVDERLALEKVERRERFLRALLDTGAFASAESSEFDDVKLTEIYQLVLLDDEGEKAELGASLIVAFKRGDCLPVVRPVLVRMLKELPIGALKLLAEISRCWHRACEDVNVDPEVASDPRRTYFHALVRDLAWSITPDNRREGDMLTSSYRLMLLQAGALQPARQDSQPVDIPPPSSLGLLLVRLCDLRTPTPEWRPVPDAIALGIPQGTVEVRRSTGTGHETRIGSCSRKQVGSSFEHWFHPIGVEVLGSKRAKRSPEPLEKFEEIREVRSLTRAPS